MATDLLLYKAIFGGDEFGRLLALSQDAELAQVLGAIRDETSDQARATLKVLREWDARGGLGRVEPELRLRVLEDLLHVKESAVEANLLVAMRAPTADLRREFVKLADVDRRHAEVIRGLVEARRERGRIVEAEPPAQALGAHAGREEESLSKSVQRSIAALRADGQEPSLIVLSAVALRHARDEGLIGPDAATALGVPVEVDFGWRGECFAIHTTERQSLADVIAGRDTRA